jgi:hypothetical protein
MVSIATAHDDLGNEYHYISVRSKLPTLRRVFRWQHSSQWVRSLLVSRWFSVAYTQCSTLFVSCSGFNMLFTDSINYNCTFVNNAAAAGDLSPEFCAYIAAEDSFCGCPNRPNETKSACSLCPDAGIQNTYVPLLHLVLYFKWPNCCFAYCYLLLFQL